MSMTVWDQREPPTIKAVMTPFPYSIGPDEPVTAARDMMARHDIRHLPVVDGGRIIGAISLRDVRLALDAALELRPERDLQVRRICVPDPCVVDLHAPLIVVLEQMAARHIDAAIVVKNGRLAGIFTVTDVCRAFADCLTALGPDDGGRAA